MDNNSNVFVFFMLLSLPSLVWNNSFRGKILHQLVLLWMNITHMKWIIFI